MDVDIAEAQDQQLMFLARVADQAERYHDQANFTADLINNKVSRDYSPEERSTIATSFKNALNHSRNLIKTIDAIEKNQKDKNLDPALEYYRKKVQKEMLTHCLSTIKIIKDNIIARLQTDD